MGWENRKEPKQKKTDVRMKKQKAEIDSKQKNEKKEAVVSMRK
jgi:hypothetical protein